MIDKIHELKIFYHGLYKDIDYIINIFEICEQKNIKLYKRMTCKQIIMTKPKEHYVRCDIYIK